MKRRTRATRGWWAGFCASLALGNGTARADPAYQYEALAYLGTPAPAGGAFKGGFRPGAVGDEGEVAYVAAVDSSGAQALFLDTIDGLFTVAAPGTPAADGWRFAEKPGVLGGIASPVSMNAAGDIVFAADLTRGDQTGSGTFLWRRDPQMLTALSLPGQVTPGGVVLGNARSRAGIAGSGDFVLAVDLPVRGENPEPGIVLLSMGQATIIARPGDREPGGGAFLRAGCPAINGSGQIAFQADVTRDGRVSTGLFLGDGAHLAAVAGENTAAPDGSPFRAAREPRLNDRADLAFLGDTGEWGVYLSENGRLSRLAGPGTALPGSARAAAVVTGEGSLALNQEGMVAMVLTVEKRDAAGLFLYQHGQLWSAALPGTFLAGVGPIDNVGPWIALSDQGQVAFQAELADGHVALVLATPVPSGG